MGALYTNRKFEAVDPKVWFDEAYAEAVWQWGKDMYNGTISTTQFGEIIKVPEADIQSLKEDHSIIMVENSPYTKYFKKWTTNFLDLGVTGYSVQAAKYTPVNEKVPIILKKGVSQSPVRYKIGFKAPHPIGYVLENSTYRSFIEAKRRASSAALNTNHPVHILRVNSASEPVEVKGFYECAEIKRTSDLPMISKGQVRKDVHTYIAIIGAAC